MSPIRRSMCCDVTVYRRRRNANVRPTWAEFIRTHLAPLAATDFFTVEVLTLRGPVTYYVLFFIHLESRRVDVAGITAHPDEPWMEQMARNVIILLPWGSALARAPMLNTQAPYFYRFKVGVLKRLLRPTVSCHSVIPVKTTSGSAMPKWTNS